jgi:hypothetical protein
MVGAAAALITSTIPKRSSMHVLFIIDFMQSPHWAQDRILYQNELIKIYFLSIFSFYTTSLSK